MIKDYFLAILLTLLFSSSFCVYRKNASGFIQLYPDSSVDGITISQNGWIGIGTDSPQNKMDVAGTLNATTYLGDGSKLTGVTAQTANVALALKSPLISQFTNDSGYLTGSVSLAKGAAQVLNAGDVITAGNYNYKIVSSIPNNNIITLANGFYDGQIFIIIASGTKTFTLKSTPSIHIHGDCTFTNAQTLTLIWASDIGTWVELSRSPNN